MSKEIEIDLSPKIRAANEGKINYEKIITTTCIDACNRL
jgi:hypothetical protein